MQGNLECLNKGCIFTPDFTADKAVLQDAKVVFVIGEYFFVNKWEKLRE